MSLSCRINNVNSENYKNLILRKFFQITFVSESFKHVDIYTAIVVGGGDDNNISKLRNDFKVEVAFSSTEKSSIKHYNLTGDFLNEIQCIRAVWGHECEVLSNQESVRKALQGIYKEEIEAESYSIDRGKTTVTNESYLHISDNRKIKDKKGLSIVAIKGKVDIDNCNGLFSVSCQDVGKTLHDGVELISWVKTTIQFDNVIDEESQREYNIVLEPDACNFYSPDFTFYISPPPNYIVNYDYATTEKIEGNGVSTGALRDLIQSVSPQGTVQFNEWKSIHHILSRKMSRLVPGQMSEPGKAGKKIIYKELRVKYSLDNPSKQPISTFVYGILLSAVLALGTDYTRMNVVKDFFYFHDYIKPDVSWIAISLLALSTMFVASLRLKDSPEKFLMKLYRCLSKWGYIFWASCLFVLYRMDAPFVKDMLSVFKVINTMTIGVVLISSIMFLASANKQTLEYPLRSIFKF